MIRTFTWLMEPMQGLHGDGVGCGDYFGMEDGDGKMDQCNCNGEPRRLYRKVADQSPLLYNHCFHSSPWVCRYE